MRLLTLAVIPCALVVGITTAAASQDHHYYLQEQSSGLRDNAVRVAVSNEAVAAKFTKAMKDRTGLEFVAMRAPVWNKQEVLAQPKNPDAMCPTVELLDDDRGWKVLTGRDLTSEQRAVLDSGKGLSLNRECSDQIGFITFEGDKGKLLGKPMDLAFVETDTHTAGTNGVVMWRKTAEAHGLSAKITAVEADDAEGVSMNNRDAFLHTVESSGLAASDVRFGGRPHRELPLVMKSVVIEATLLMVALLVTAALVIAGEERGTQVLLSNLGYRPWQRWLLQLVTVALPVLVGTALGYLLGVILSESIIPGRFAETVHYSTASLPPLYALGLLPVLAWLTTPRLN